MSEGKDMQSKLSADAPVFEPKKRIDVPETGAAAVSENFFCNYNVFIYLYIMYYSVFNSY